LSNPSSKEKFESKKLPMMPIRDVVIFPYMMTPFVVGRESSVRALEEALATDKKIFLATQHDASIDEPKANDIFQVGTIVNICLLYTSFPPAPRQYHLHWHSH